MTEHTETTAIETTSGTLPGAIEVEVYESFEAAGFMQREWDDFIESVNGEIFLTYDWCRIWWKYYGTGRNLRIFVFLRDKAIAGILPIFFEKLGVGPFGLRVVRFVATDHMPVTIMFPVDARYIGDILPRFVDELSRTSHWDLLYIGALCGRFDAIDKVVDAFRSTWAIDYHLDVKTTDVQTYFQIAKSWEEQLSGLKKKQRENIKRAYKKLNPGNHEIVLSFADVSTVEEYFDDFMKMHQQQWQASGAAGHFVDWPHAAEFHREVALAQMTKNRLRLLKIGDNSSCIGFKYGYRFGKTYYQYLSARNLAGDSTEGGFNQVSFGEQVKKAIEEKVTCIDSMRGVYPHKIHLGGTLHQIKHIFIYPKRGTIKLQITGFRRLAELFDIIYNKIWRRRVIPKIGIKPGPFNLFWIKVHQLSLHDTVIEQQLTEKTT